MNSQRIRVLKNEAEGRLDFEQNTGNGIHAWKRDSLLIEGNQTRECCDGIYLEFVTNSFDVNFWDKYDGYDLNRNGIGDVPNHPVSLFATGH